MSRAETYSYGQGKVYLAERLPSGEIGVQRWVGDVSELSISLNVEDLTHKESYSGNRQEVRKIITANASSASSLIASSISALASSLDELSTIAIVVSTALGVRLLFRPNGTAREQ